MSSHRYSARAKRTVSKSMPSMLRLLGLGARGWGLAERSAEAFARRRQLAPRPQPQLLSLADFLTTLTGIRRVLAFLAALRDDDLELVHIRCRRRSAGPAVNRRTGGEKVLAPFLGQWGVLFFPPPAVFSHALSPGGC